MAINDGIREKIVEEAKTWIGTPYHHKADVKHHGVDCAMLLIRVYNAVGVIPLIDVGNYSPQWHLHRNDELYLGWIKRYCIETSIPKAGDIALYKFGRCVSHAAIIVEWPLVIHALSGVGCVYDDTLKNCDLQKRLYKIYEVLA